MVRKIKKDTWQAFQVRDPDSYEVMRDVAGKVITISAYTSKAAKHQAKTMFGPGVVVEPRT